MTGRGLVVFALIPAPAITLSAPWQGCQLLRWTARMEGEFRNWMAINFQHNIQQRDNILSDYHAFVDEAMILIGALDAVILKVKAKPILWTHTDVFSAMTKVLPW